MQTCIAAHLWSANQLRSMAPEKQTCPLQLYTLSQHRSHAWTLHVPLSFKSCCQAESERLRMQLIQRVNLDALPQLLEQHHDNCLQLVLPNLQSSYVPDQQNPPLVGSESIDEAGISRGSCPRGAKASCTFCSPVSHHDKMVLQACNLSEALSSAHVARTCCPVTMQVASW